MAIAFDSTSNSAAFTPTTVVTWASGSIASGATMFVCTLSRDDDNTDLTADGSAAGVTQVAAVFNATSVIVIRLWSITGLGPGTHTLSFAISGAASYAAGADVSLTGVKTSSFIGDTDAVTGLGSNAAFTAMVPTASSSAIVDCIGTDEGSALTMNALTNRTERANFQAKSSNRYVGMSTLIPAGSSGSNIAMGWDDLNNNWAYVGIEILAAATPTLTNISPGSGAQGDVVAITLTGTNFVIGSTTINISPSGITPSGISVASATSLTAIFTISAVAAIGSYDVTVTTPDGTSNSVSFEVTSAPTPPSGVSDCDLLLLKILG